MVGDYLSTGAFASKDFKEKLEDPTVIENSNQWLRSV
jgi:hypothetical protein